MGQLALSVVIGGNHFQIYHRAMNKGIIRYLNRVSLNIYPILGVSGTVQKTLFAAHYYSTLFVLLFQPSSIKRGRQHDLDGCVNTSVQSILFIGPTQVVHSVFPNKAVYYQCNIGCLRIPPRVGKLAFVRWCVVLKHETTGIAPRPRVVVRGGWVSQRRRIDT